MLLACVSVCLSVRVCVFVSVCVCGRMRLNCSPADGEDWKLIGICTPKHTEDFVRVYTQVLTMFRFL